MNNYSLKDWNENNQPFEAHEDENGYYITLKLDWFNEFYFRVCRVDNLEDLYKIKKY